MRIFEIKKVISNMLSVIDPDGVFIKLCEKSNLGKNWQGILESRFDDDKLMAAVLKVTIKRVKEFVFNIPSEHGCSYDRGSARIYVVGEDSSYCSELQFSILHNLQADECARLKEPLLDMLDTYFGEDSGLLEYIENELVKKYSIEDFLERSKQIEPLPLQQKGLQQLQPETN